MQRTEIEKVLRDHPDAVFGIRNGAALGGAWTEQRERRLFGQPTEMVHYLVGVRLYRDDAGEWRPGEGEAKALPRDVKRWYPNLTAYKAAWEERNQVDRERREEMRRMAEERTALRSAMEVALERIGCRADVYTGSSLIEIRLDYDTARKLVAWAEAHPVA